MSWVLFPILWFALMALCAAGSRQLARKRTTPERQTEIARYSSKLTAATATGLFVLIGFATTMSWNTYTAAQSAIDAQFVAADELIVAVEALPNTQQRDEILESLAQYLDTLIAQDIEHFRENEDFPAPSRDSIGDLQRAASAVVVNPVASQTIQIDLIEDAVKELAKQRGVVLSVSNRVLPNVMMALIMLSTLFVAIFMGASLSDEDRPWLLFGWVFVLTLALAVMVWIAHPFAAPLGIDLSALENLADTARNDINSPPAGN